MGRGSKRRGRPHPYSDTDQAGRPVMSAEAARRQMEEGDGRLVPFIRGREIDAGDLSGDVVEPVQASFTYFGQRFRVNPNLTETMVVDLLEAGENIEVNDPRQLIAAKDYVRDHIHPDDFDAFWQTSIDNRQGVQAVIKVCWKLLERITERPTTPPSDSSDGRPVTVMSSAGGASAQATESALSGEVQPPAEGNLREVAQHFIEKFESRGRPDLACQIALAEESRARRGLVTV